MANWQAAQPGTVIGDDQGNYQIRVGGQWMPMPKGSLAADEHGAYHFDSDLIQPPPAPKATTAAAPAATVASKALAANEGSPGGDIMNVGLRSVLHLPYAAAHGLVDILRGATGQDTNAPQSDLPGESYTRPSAQENQTISGIAGTAPVQAAANAAGPVIQKVGQGVSAADTALGNANPTLQGLLHRSLQVGSDVANIAPVAAAVRGVGAMGAGAESATAAAAGNDAAAANIGMDHLGNHGLPANAADAPQVMQLKNQGVKRALGNEAGVPADQEVTHAALTSAADVPGRIMTQGADLVPEGPLSPAAQQTLIAARPTPSALPGSPNLAKYVQQTEANMLPNAQGEAPSLTGTSVKATRNDANSAAAAGRMSTDPEQRALAKYQQQIVGVMDQHVADTMPANSAISPAMLATARTTLAKNYQLRDLLGPGDQVDLPALAADFRQNPNRLTGAFKVAGQFANEHPLETQVPSAETLARPPGVMHDLANLNPLRPLGTGAQAATGWANRFFLNRPTGNPASVPVTGLGGEFDFRPGMTGPTPGTIGEAPSRQGELPLEPPNTPTPPENEQPGPPGPLPTSGIQATPIKLGNQVPGQRGAVGPPIDISKLRQLMNNPRTYGGEPAAPPTQAELTAAALQKMLGEQHSYTGLGSEFAPATPGGGTIGSLLGLADDLAGPANNQGVSAKKRKPRD